VVVVWCLQEVELPKIRESVFNFQISKTPGEDQQEYILKSLGDFLDLRHPPPSWEIWEADDILVPRAENM
jgi:hypothetical protein